MFSNVYAGVASVRFFPFLRRCTAFPPTHARCFCLEPPIKLHSGGIPPSDLSNPSVSPLVQSDDAMLSELECGICYRLFDTGRRCPRQLDCKHSFCESCLLTLTACRSEDPQSGPRIICAFCRHTTPLNDEKLRDNLPVDEDILNRLKAEGVLEDSASDGEDDEESRTDTTGQSKEDHLPRTQRGRLWRSIIRLYKKMKGPSRRGEWSLIQ